MARSMARIKALTVEERSGRSEEDDEGSSAKVLQETPPSREDVRLGKVSRVSGKGGEVVCRRTLGTMTSAPLGSSDWGGIPPGGVLNRRGEVENRAEGLKAGARREERMEVDGRTAERASTGARAAT
jgi:hypothetical protein